MHYTTSKSGMKIRISTKRSERKSTKKEISIMNGYYTREHEMQMKADMLTRASSRADRVLDVLFAMIAALAGVLRDKTVRTVLRYGIVAVCFFCFLGLIGGIEQGLVSIGGGIVLGLLLVFVEILCLK
jgi:hypothetical protein